MMKLKKFLKEEDGAVTIDWVALTAGIVLLGMAVVYGIFSSGVDPLVSSINAELLGAGDLNCTTDEASGVMTCSDTAG